MLSAFSARYPGVEIRIHETHTVALLRELSDGELDFIADNGDFDPNQYTREPFQRERLLLMTPAAWPIAQQTAAYRLSAEEIHQSRHLSEAMPTIPLELFKDLPFLLLKEGNDTRARADALCASAGFHARPRLLLDQQITAYNLACYGMGAAFVSDTLVQHVPPVPGVWFYKLGSERALREICFYYRRSRYLSSAALELMRMVRELSKAGGCE